MRSAEEGDVTARPLGKNALITSPREEGVPDMADSLRGKSFRSPVVPEAWARRSRGWWSVVAGRW